MGVVAKLFQETKKRAEEHLNDHPDCPLFAPHAWALTDEIRADLLGTVSEARKAGIIDYEDEFDLEHAIGTYGDPENFGWPDTTEGWMKFATAELCLGLIHAVEEGDTDADPLARLLSALSGAHEENVGVVAIPASDLPKELADAIRKAALDQTEEAKQPTAEVDEDIDWIRRGYL